MQERPDEIENMIIPQRFIPFDLGTYIDEPLGKEIQMYCKENHYEVLKKPALLESISSDVRLLIDINKVCLRLYIFSYGIGVFCLEDNSYNLGEKYAVGYCDYRKQAHKEILRDRNQETTQNLMKIIDDLRRIVADKKKNIRMSASKDWEQQGLSYVMTVSYIIKKDKTHNIYKDFDEIEKKDLQIMLQPCLAHMEDTLSVKDYGDEPFNPYNFDVEEIDEPRNWIKSEDCSIYISWAAVVVYLKYLKGNYMEIIEYLEADLQAMWLYTYCSYNTLKHQEKLSSSYLKKEKYQFQRKYNEFYADKDSSLPVYITEIRKELLRTSGIEKQKNNYIDYIEYCIEDAGGMEVERQRRYEVINEILLFIIAFLQIAPMLYSAMIGGLENIHIIPVLIMVVIVIIAIFLIIKKD